jgi:hypothetical protein
VPKENNPAVSRVVFGSTSADYLSARIARDRPADRCSNATSIGRGADYLAARIARDRPDVLERMKKGEFKSARAAAKEAGIVKDKTPLDVVKSAWKRADARQRVARHPPSVFPLPHLCRWQSPVPGAGSVESE